MNISKSIEYISFHHGLLYLCSMEKSFFYLQTCLDGLTLENCDIQVEINAYGNLMKSSSVMEITM